MASKLRSELQAATSSVTRLAHQAMSGAFGRDTCLRPSGRSDARARRQIRTSDAHIGRATRGGFGKIRRGDTSKSSA
jgi:hypothetical protein